MTKIGIVASEGGMKCAYSVGAILGLVEKYNLTDPHVVVGSSGSTGTLAYYVAGQYRGIRNIWENLLSTRKFVSLWRLYRIMDIDYLIDQVFKKQEPLDVNAIESSKIKLFIAATDVKIKKAKYFDNHSDIFEALRASCAIPIFYNKQVWINGRNYTDGALSADFAYNIKKAFEESADKVIGIYNIYPFKSFEPAYDNDRLIVIQPSSKLPVSTLNNNQEAIKKTIRMGYQDVINNEKLENFLA